MTRVRIFLWLFMISILVSCDCYVSVKGKVFSNSDKHPIEGATIEMVGRNKTTKTNKDGYFHIWEQTGFCFDPQIKITTNNYKPCEITFKGSTDSKSFELKSESDFVNYEKPFYPDTNNKGTFIVGTWIEKYSENFAFSGDTVLFYLDTINPKKEIEKIKAQIRRSN